MKTLAAVLVETKKPLVLTELEVPALKPGQALVEIAVSGVCHTQLLECRGLRGEDRFLPHCLGHEGSGVVREVGAGVSKVKPGDIVVLSWMKGGGADVPGTVYRWDQREVNAGAITTFSRYAVISENRLTVLRGKISMTMAALLGCAVPTGAGAVMNTAGAKAGQSVAVLGLGGVGLCAVAAAKAKGCTPVIAVDINPAKLATAREMGATHTIDAKGKSAAQEILKMCPQGVDIAIEASGQTTVMAEALASVHARGGTAVIVGNAPHGARLDLNPAEFNQGKRLLGTWGGDNLPDRDFPSYMELVAARAFNAEPLTTQVYGLSRINDALADLENGAALRPLIDMTQ